MVNNIFYISLRTWIKVVSFKASRWSHKIIIETLLSNGANVNVKDNLGSTSLHSGELILTNFIIRSI